jgi:hypothetical protein
VEENKFSVRNSVADSAGRLIRDARIEVMNGPHAGLATLTDSTGLYSFDVTFTPGTRLRASKTGCREQMRDLRNERDAWFRLCEPIGLACPCLKITPAFGFPIVELVNADSHLIIDGHAEDQRFACHSHV